MSAIAGTTRDVVSQTIQIQGVPLHVVGGSEAALLQSFKSGEGLVFDFTGPGTVLTQTRNPNELLGWITAAVGTSNSGVGTGLGLGSTASQLAR